MHLPFLFLSINLSLPHPSIHLSFLFLSINLTLPSPIRHLPFLFLSCVHQSYFTPHLYLHYLSIPFPPFYQSSLLSTNQPTLPYAFLSYSFHCLNPLLRPVFYPIPPPYTGHFPFISHSLPIPPLPTFLNLTT